MIAMTRYLSEDPIVFPFKGSWSNEELRVVQAAYELVLRQEISLRDVSELEKESLARKIMALAQQGRLDARELARRFLADREGTEALLRPLSSLPPARRLFTEDNMEKRIEFNGAFAPTALRALTPGSSYVGVRCRNCELHVGLFEDIADSDQVFFAGEASFDFECPNCGSRAVYSAEDLTQFKSAQGGAFSTS